MKFTRDGAIWWVGLIAGALGVIGGSFKLLHEAFPALDPAWDARLTLASAIVGFLSGYLRMSPLALSADHPIATNEASQKLSITGKPLVGIVLAVALAGASCVRPNPQLPAGADVILRAKTAVVAIGTMQHAAIELNKIQVCDPKPCHPLLSDSNTGVVVDAATDALKTLRAVPDGWKATADAAVVRVEHRLDAGGKSQFTVYLEAARLAIKAIGGQ